MAIYAMKGFGWLLCGALVAPGCYMVTSRVAAERARLEATERAIVQAKKDIRDLEIEFETRANLAQLERWNGDVLALSAPTSDQYLPGEAELASLRPLQDGGQVYRHAVLLVPAGGAPVTGVAAASATVPVTGAVPPARADAGKAAANGERARERGASGDVALASLNRDVRDAAASSEPVRGPSHVAEKFKGEAMAMLDDKLLSDSTFAELMQAGGKSAKRAAR